MLRSWIGALTACLAVLVASVAHACGPGALGTSRELVVPASHGHVGDISYRRSLPLARGEVVLTFDDGPMPGRTAAVLDALKRDCVKATFFVVGTMVARTPSLLRRIAEDGHTVASHTWSHGYLNRMRGTLRQRDQIGGGILATSAALGPDHASLAPFFRFPGLGRTTALDRYVAEKNLISMSADIVGDDWHRIGSAAVLDRVMRRLEARGRGIILLHDIHARTVDMLPALLTRLREGGYRVVHLVSAPRDMERTLALVDPPQNARIRLALGRLDARPVAVAAATPRALAAPVPPAMPQTAASPAASPPVVAPSPEFELVQEASVAPSAPARIETAALHAAPRPEIRSASLDAPPPRSAAARKTGGFEVVAGETGLLFREIGLRR